MPFSNVENLCFFQPEGIVSLADILVCIAFFSVEKSLICAILNNPTVTDYFNKVVHNFECGFVFVFSSPLDLQ